MLNPYLHTGSPTASGQRLPLLDADLLRTFVAIAETSSFTRAAELVSRTPGAVSMQVKKLEKTLGCSLFVREARQVRLTSDGEALLGYARRLVALNEETVARFLRPAINGAVRFGVTDDVGTRILPGVLARFARTHPGVQVEVRAGHSEALRRRVTRGDLDLALVTAGDGARGGANEETVHREALVWAGLDTGTAAERRPLPLALAAEGCAWRALALAALDRAGLEYRVAYTSEHTAGQEAAMSADLAVAPFPASLVRAPLRRLADDAGLPPIGRYRVALVRAPRLSAVASVLAEQVAAQFGEPA